MNDVLLLMKVECVAALCLASGLAAYDSLARPESWLRRLHPLYVAYLNRKLHRMLMPQVGKRIAALQVVALALLSLVGVACAERWLLAVGVLLIVAPACCLRLLHAQRVAKIDEQVDGFLLTLANALRATPSLGNALHSTEALVAVPLNKELGVALQELRLGSNLDQSLLNMSARVQSAALDSGVSALLIGRQLGGDLSRVLETTAATLRELRRLQGVLKTKTSEARAQMWALALIPPALVWGLEKAMPGYFEPLTSVLVGRVVIGVAVLLWLASVLVARAILKVDL